MDKPKLPAIVQDCLSHSTDHSPCHKRLRHIHRQVMHRRFLLDIIFICLTGFNIYPRIAKWGGAGTLVPITGFANSVAAPAIEYKKEGQVMGIGCKIFTIAGPVILYGIFTSWVLGFGYWILKISGII